ncbi:unnamed protein product [Closterium sp. NIES-64]|nr:unnamed protein product [Closterium sp. NIES-64]
MGKSKAVLALLAIMVVIAASPLRASQAADATSGKAASVATTPASNTTAPASNTTAPASNTTAPSEYPDAESLSNEKWEAISSILVMGNDWRCKDVYTVYGLMLQQFTAMNPGINCSALLPRGRELVVRELLPACSAFYYTQPADTCSSVAQFLSITEESLQQLNPSVSCSSRPLAFRSLCVERNPAKAKPKCLNMIPIRRVVDFKQVAASNGATMVDLCRLNPWISFRNSLRDTDGLCVSAHYSTPPPGNTTAPASNTLAPSEYPDAESLSTGVCGYDRVNPCLGGTCIHRGAMGRTCVCLPNHRWNGSYFDEKWEAISSITVVGSDWRCKDVYTVYGLTLQQFTAMNPGTNCSALLPRGRELVVRELLPACSAFYYTQPADTCSSVAQFLNITEESLQQLNPSVSCSSRPLAFRSLCVERNPAKAKPKCLNMIPIRRVVDFKQVAASNGATMVDLCRLNPWISFRNSLRDTDGLCVSAHYSTPPPGNTTAPASNTLAPSEYPDAESLSTGVCGYDRVNPCLGGTCIHRGAMGRTCVCLPNHRWNGSYCDEKWEAISSITVVGSDWRCKDVYTVYGLTLQQFTAMNPGTNCSALLPRGRELVVRELLPACSAFYYTQPADTCSSVAQFLNITEESLQQLNPSVTCSSRLPSFRPLCVERNPAKARPKCGSQIQIGRVVDFKQVAASNGATMVDLCRLNPWISFRDSLRNIDGLCVSAQYATPPPGDTTAPASNTTAPASNTTAPASNTTAPASNTTVDASNTTAPASNTTAPASNTTAPASNTTAPSEYPDAEISSNDYWVAVSSIRVAGSNWRCKDVYTVYGLTLQQFTDMNHGIDCSALLPQGRELVVKELLPACSAFYYVQPVGLTL